MIMVVVFDFCIWSWFSFYVMVVVVLFVVINLVVDVLYSVLDPRVRLTEAKA